MLVIRSECPRSRTLPQPCILVAEDDRYLAAMVKQTLEGEGMRVTVASNGADALVHADSLCPDLVILDVSMPILSGFDVLRTLKSDRFHLGTPVLMLTALRNESDVRRALGNGAADYMTKPFRPDQLIMRVGRLLRAGRATAGPDESTRAVLV